MESDMAIQLTHQGVEKMKKNELVKKYLRALKFSDVRWMETSSLHALDDLNTDHLEGWNNPKTLVPQHLMGKGFRYYHYEAGQAARKLRDNDHTTHIFAYRDDSSEFSKLYKSRLSHKQIVKICERENALSKITAYITDNATNKTITRNIGY